MKYLNLGCGYRYHSSWTNVDFVSTGPNVMAYNLLKGIPFEKESFDVVYHSHVLEHFSQDDGMSFLRECFRVLKPNGLIRIAVPDLEVIAREYIKNLELALEGNKEASLNYEWIKLEMYDQTVRNKSGGNMAKFLSQKEIPNEAYVFGRVGEEAKSIQKIHLIPAVPTSEISLIRLKYFIKNTIKRFYKKINKTHLNTFQKEIEIGRFRTGGEIHQWMYDRYSLNKILQEVGFNQTEVKTAFTSQIPNWDSFKLESNNNNIFKPDSLFMEAVKC